MVRDDELTAEILKCASDIKLAQTEEEQTNMSTLIADVTTMASKWPRFQGYDIYEVEAVVRDVLENTPLPT